MNNSNNSLANTRQRLAASGVRLNAFGQPFYGSKIKGVQRKTYMGGGDQGPIYKRPTQATGTKGVEMEVERRERARAEAAATSPAAASSKPVSTPITTAPAPGRFAAAAHRSATAAKKLAELRRRKVTPSFDGKTREEFFKTGTKPQIYADARRVA